MLESAQTDVVLQATKDKSLQKALSLAKFNSLLDQSLAHIHHFDKFEEDKLVANQFLENEGIIRESGSVDKINDAFRQMLGDPLEDLKGDPTSNPLSAFRDFTSNQNNVIGLIKKGLREYKVQWSKEAQDEFENFRQKNAGGESKMSFEELIKILLAKNLVEEAKALHNLLHLLNNARHFENKNKMNANNLGIAIAPSIAIFFGNHLAIDSATQSFLSVHSHAQLAAGRERLHEAMQSNYFSKTFSATNPEVAAKMAKQYDDNKKYPPIVKPVVFLGFKLPMWLSKIIRALAPKSPTEQSKRPSLHEAVESKVSTQAMAHEELGSMPVGVPVVAVEKEVKVETSKVEPSKRKEFLSKHRKVQQKDLDEGLEKFPFAARKMSVTNKLQNIEAKKSNHKKKPTRKT